MQIDSIKQSQAKALKVPSIMQKIFAQKRALPLAPRKERNLEKMPLISPNLNKKEPFIIAEIKRASPSAGHIGDIKSPENLAKEYLSGGANAISVLCENAHFGGSLVDLEAVKAAHPLACILRKDFISELGQITESYEAGADMVLLIVAGFVGENNELGGFAQFSKLYYECEKFGLCALIEIHNEDELEFIKELKPRLLGINCRNLHDFSIDKIAAFSLFEKAQKIAQKVIFESSINSAHEAFEAASVGFGGILCGSFLVRQNAPKQALQELKEALSAGLKEYEARGENGGFYGIISRKFSSLKNTPQIQQKAERSEVLAQDSIKNLPFIKICGQTSYENAKECAKYADALGFILVKQSPRFVEKEQVKKIIQKLKEDLSKSAQMPLFVAVVGDDEAQMQSAIELQKNGLIDAIQTHGVNSKNRENFGGIYLTKAHFCFFEVQSIAQSGKNNESFIESSASAANGELIESSANITNSDILEEISKCSSLFCLLDCANKKAAQNGGGGGGESIERKILAQIAAKMKYLCVAGGVGFFELKNAKFLDSMNLDSIESNSSNSDSIKLNSINLDSIESDSIKKPQKITQDSIKKDSISLQNLRNLNAVFLDLNSALETKPGQKDPQKLKIFFEKLNEVF